MMFSLYIYVSGSILSKLTQKKKKKMNKQAVWLHIKRRKQAGDSDLVTALVTSWATELYIKSFSGPRETLQPHAV